MKLLFACIFLGAAVWALDKVEDDEYAFNIYDDEWSNLYRGAIENMTWDEIVAVVRTSSDEPEMQQLADVLEELGEVASSIDIGEVHDSVDPDAFRTICEIVIDKGYPCEEHVFKTTDGFFLESFRIPHGKNSTVKGPPVLLSHGLFDSAGTWVVNSPEESLAYLMADAGYDVWMGNIRGNKYGDKHNVYNDWNKELWAHSFDEHGTYDIPLAINFILSHSSYSKVGIVGHSQGCAQLFSTVAQHPDVGDKLAAFAGLAPAGYMRYQKNVLVLTAAYSKLGELLSFFGIKKAFPLPQFVIDMIPYVCHTAPRTVELMLSLLMGPNRGEWDYTRTSVMCSHSLGFTSMQNLIHWAQLVRSKQFQWHDYGSWENRKRYGQSKPPAYNLNKQWPQQVPVAIYYSENDDLATQGDVEQIISEFPIPPHTKYVRRYSHEDYLWAITARYEVYYDLIDFFKLHHN